MDDDAKKLIAVIGTVATMFIIGEHAINQERSLWTRLKGYFGG